jgi:ribonuclease Z
MKPVFQPALVNDYFGDPAVYVDFLFQGRALLFDLGDLRELATRKILRLTDVFVSHAHMDHFFGFDWLLRLCLGRDLRIRLYGPSGFVHQVEAKLAAYTWNLVENYDTDFTLEATEVIDKNSACSALFRCRNRFRREMERSFRLTDRVLLDEVNHRVRFAILDHKIPSLAFALEEKQHVNIRKNRLDELRLEPGPWLQHFKRAVLENLPGDTEIRALRRAGTEPRETVFRLDELAGDIAHASDGQKVAYVTDAVYHEENAKRIIELARGADQLFIEAVFGHELSGRAAEKFHLTARQAGLLARRAGVKFPTPFHFSPIYRGREAELREEFEAAFRDEVDADSDPADEPTITR